MKPLAIMFPSLLEGDPQTLEGMLNKAMSTTEVTRHLVDLGEKANFAGMKKANRLIPPDKVYLHVFGCLRNIIGIVHSNLQEYLKIL